MCVGENTKYFVERNLFLKFISFDEPVSLQATLQLT